MGCCGSKKNAGTPHRVVVGGTSSITAGQTPSKDKPEDSSKQRWSSSKERDSEIELDAHLEALASNMDFVSTVLQSSFVSENASLREQFDLALKETTPEEIDEANDTYFTAAEQENALQKFGFISSPGVPGEGQRRFNWQKGELLGVGAFGRVYMGLDTDTGQMLAVKQVTLGGHASSKQFMEQMRSLETEISLLRPLNHPNIVRCYGCERDQVRACVALPAPTPFLIQISLFLAEIRMSSTSSSSWCRAARSPRSSRSSVPSQSRWWRCTRGRS